MTAFRDFLQFVLPYAPTVADIAAERAVRDASIEFCMKSRVWHVMLDDLSVKAGSSVVELDAPDQGQIVRVSEAFYDGRKLEPVAPENIGSLYRNWTTEVGTPQYYVMFTPTEMTLVPKPDKTTRNSLQVRVYAAPSRTSNNIPDFIFDRYGKCIGYGALSRLMVEPNQAHTNPQLAASYMGLFMTGIDDARREGQTGFSRARFNTSAVYF